MINSARLFALLLLICTSSLVACSSDSPNGGLGGPRKCGQVAPCGGGVVGHWTIDGACVDPDALDNADLESVKQFCPDLTYQTSYEASGTADFTATNYTYDMDIRVT